METAQDYRRLAWDCLQLSEAAHAAAGPACRALGQNGGPGGEQGQLARLPTTIKPPDSPRQKKEPWPKYRRGMTRPIGVKPEGSKQDRVAAQSAKMEAGQVHLPKDALWLNDFLNELLAFPNARHDDQVDSVSHFLCWAQRDMHLNKIVIVAPIIISRP